MKFRGKTPEGKFVYGYYYIDEDGDMVINGEDDSRIYLVEEAAAYVCKDKDGKELYEGDVVKDSGGTKYRVFLRPAYEYYDDKFEDLAKV